MGIVMALFLSVIVIILLLVSILIPGLNIFAVLNPKKKYFTKAVVSNNQLLLKGFRKQVSLDANKIKKLSMGPFALRTMLGDKGMLAVQIDTGDNIYYVFQAPFNLFAPALKKEVISQLKAINPNIELDHNLKKYTEESLADMYINKAQIKRGLLLLLIIFIVGIIVYFLG